VELENELGWSIRPEAAAQNLATLENPGININDIGSWRTAKMIDRYTGRLFGEILVPVTGLEGSWVVLEQAILIAKKEQSVLRGLHVIPSREKTNDSQLQAIQMRFNQLCLEGNVTASFIMDKGSVPRQVCERALLTDLIVLNTAHPPTPGIPSLYSGLRAIIRGSARPILTVAEKTSPMDNALLAFDGSVKSREALFVAAYLVEKWQTRLTVLTVGNSAVQGAQEYARSYLELHEIRADYLIKSGPRDIFLGIIRDYQINLVVMGSYSGVALKEVIVDSTVNYLLRKTNCSLLVCR
jgi:nucleotide-binding universal stress UspA family protein